MNASPTTVPDVGDVEIYVDPACPFAWAASRWLAGVAERRGVGATWRPMSLAVLNEDREVGGAHAERMIVSRRTGRLLAAAGDEAMRELYFALGRRLHSDGSPLSERLVLEALAECALPTDLVAAMDDPVWDDAVRRAHRASQEALGGTGGSPITVFGGRAYFGPVLTGIPGRDEADRLFDALTTLAGTTAFAQVERPRSGPPNLAEVA
ncbi:DsbA family protein [Gordonia polyisoprenivorans]|uniref:mycothiol-dependent nitroreductase Rv2466c family protein n=1 Tax=Gordonia polyisoprenivorans TaxID=84595 RepID=UPI001AD6F974|nr:DsbA family protein [Gordonia polyisoprenivorans]QTI68718.1 DsbA family protein [Gordonia polyisoprenivorans]